MYLSFFFINYFWATFLCYLLNNEKIYFLLYIYVCVYIYTHNFFDDILCTF